VIDEIDGALSDGKGAVEVLLKMVLEWHSDFVSSCSMMYT